MGSILNVRQDDLIGLDPENQGTGTGYTPKWILSNYGPPFNVEGTNTPEFEHGTRWTP